jgi:HPt (histidine-containing phosphotransfer) domain-containing protein
MQGQDPSSDNEIYSSYADDPDMAEMLPFFVDGLAEIRSGLRTLADAKDFEGVRREAHKVRGTAGGYGFQGLSDLAGRLEESCKNSPRDEAMILRTVDEILDYLVKVRA